MPRFLTAGALRDIGISTLVGFGIFYYFANLEGVASELQSTAFLTSPLFWVVVAALSLPYDMYFFIWTNPSKWLSMTSSFPLRLLGAGQGGQRAVSVFSTMCLLLKVVQLGALFWHSAWHVYTAWHVHTAWHVFSV